MVEIWFKKADQPILREGLKSIYEKGSYTCFQLEKNVEKYPTNLIFRIVEPYTKVEPCEKVGPREYTCQATIPKTGIIQTSIRQVAIALVERKAGVKLSAKGREYVCVLLQLTNNLDDIAKTIKDLAEYFEMEEG